MKFITPVEITDAEFVSSNVPEDDYDEWAGSFLLVSLNQTSRYWRGMAAAPNGDIYACVYGGDIYKQTAGAGNFTALSQTSRNWIGMCAAPNGNIYACVSNGSIYMQTAGAGDFADLSQTSRYWNSMCAAPNGDIYASVNNGDIYKQTSGAGNFTALSQTSRAWRGMAASPNGDIYACVSLGDIYKQTAGAGNFTPLSQVSRSWEGICADVYGSIYASVNNGDIYKQTSGAGDFTALSQTSRQWDSMCAAPGGDVYCTVFNTDIYKAEQSIYNSGDIIIVTDVGVHKIYESLKNNNSANYPPDDNQDSPTYWLEVSPTNRWKAFDEQLGTQTEQATSIEFVIAPGAVDSIALLNLESTSINVTMIENSSSSAEVYNETVVTGIDITDVVLLDLPEYEDCEITVTITYTGGTAKIGELIVGTQTNLGDTLSNPSFGITDYSTKEQDIYGHYTILERDFAKKMECSVFIDPDDINTVARLLAETRAAAKVWIGHEDYSALIVYGFYKDYSISMPNENGAFLSIEIEGLT